MLPLAFVLIALLPAEAETVEAAQVIDFFYSVFLMLVLVVVVLGSFTFMTLTRSGYLQSLTATIFLTAGNMTHTPGYGHLIALGIHDVVRQRKVSPQQTTSAAN